MECRVAMNKIWAMDERFLVDYLEKTSSEFYISPEAETLVFDSMNSVEIMTVSDGVATVEVRGPLSKIGPNIFDMLFGFGGTAYGDIVDALNAAESRDDVERIVLDMDTPGGEVNGVDEVWQTVSGTKKPVMAVNSGLLASAGYWIASAADEIAAASPSVETGSIGVVITALDTSKRDESAGYKRVKIISRNAPNKNPDVATDDGIVELQRRADAIERIFIDRVAAGRGVSPETVVSEYGKGSVFVANDPDQNEPDAMKNGMIDKLLYTKQTNVIDLGNKSAKIAAVIDPQEEPEMEEEIKKLTSELSAIKAEKEELEARIAKASPYLASSSYPEHIRALAVAVLEGAEEPAALKGAVVAFDAMTEQKKAVKAEEETETTPEVIAQKGEALPEGVVSADNYQEYIAKKRESLGIA